jgi:hypothetical protein
MDMSNSTKESKMETLMSKTDKEILNLGMRTFRGFVIPNESEMKKAVNETRFKLAKMYYESMKKDLKKSGKINEEWFEIVKSDLEKSEKLMFA